MSEELTPKSPDQNASSPPNGNATFKFCCYNGQPSVDIGDYKEGYGRNVLRVSFSPDGQTETLQLAYQNPELSRNNIRPSDTYSTATYISVPPEELDTIELSSGAKLLIQKQPKNRIGMTADFSRYYGDSGRNDHGTTEMLRLFDRDDYAGAVNAVQDMMSRLVRVEPQNADLIASRVRNKLQGSK